MSPAPTLYDPYDRPVGRPRNDERNTGEVGHEIYASINAEQEAFIGELESGDELRDKQGFDVYEKMLNDPQVRAAMWYKVSIALAPEWDIIPASDQPVDIEQADMVEYSFRHMRTPLNQAHWDGYRGAWNSGVSVMEKTFRKITEPCEWQNWIGLDTLRPIYPGSLHFYPDRFGHLTKKGQLRQDQRDADNVALDPNKFWIYVNDPRWNNWWGHADCSPAYAPYMLKKFGMRWWGIFLERFGGPIPIGKYDDYTRPGQRDQWLKTLKKMKTMGAMIFPKSWDIEFFDASTAHTDAFDRMIVTCDKQISRALLIPELVQSEGESHGSYGLGVMQFYGPFLSHEKHRIGLAEDSFNQQVVEDLVRRNDPAGQIYEFPRFKRKEIRETPSPEIIKIMEILLTKPNWADGMDPELAEWVRSQTGVPIPTGIAPKPTEDIDKTAEEMNDIIVLMADEYKTKNRLTRVNEIHSGLRNFARAIVPGIDQGYADVVARNEAGKWARDLRELADTNLSDFSTEDHLWKFRKELKANGKQAAA